MSEIIRCPGCNKKLKVPSRYAGRVFDCPKCGQPLQLVLDEEPDIPATDSASWDPLEASQPAHQAAPPHPEAPPAAIAPTQPDQWFVHAGDRLLGPYTWTQLADMAARGVINASSNVSNSSAGPWYSAATIPGLIAPPEPATPADPSTTGGFAGWPTTPGAKSSMGSSSSPLDELKKLLPDFRNSDQMFFLIAMTLLVLTCLAAGYTVTRGIAMMAASTGHAQRMQAFDEGRQLRQEDRRRAAEDPNFQSDGNEMQRFRDLMENPSGGGLARLTGTIASLLWWAYLVALMVLAGILFAAMVKFKVQDHRNMMAFTPAMIVGGWVYFAGKSIYELQTANPVEVLTAMELAGGPFTGGRIASNIYLIALSLLALSCARTVKAGSNFEILAWIALALAVARLFLGELVIPFTFRIGRNELFCQTVTNLSWTACLAVNFWIFARVAQLLGRGRR